MSDAPVRKVRCTHCNQLLHLDAEYTGSVECAYCSQIADVKPESGEKPKSSPRLVHYMAGGTERNDHYRYPVLGVLIAAVLAGITVKLAHWLPRDLEPKPAPDVVTLKVEESTEDAVDSGIETPGEEISEPPLSQDHMAQVPRPHTEGGRTLPHPEPSKLLPSASDNALPKNWPSYTEPLSGDNEVRIDNPNNRAVKVGLRCGGKGKDFMVAIQSVRSVWVPNGSYQIFFIYQDEPDAVYQGDDFTLRDNSVIIRLVASPHGNFRLRRLP